MWFGFGDVMCDDGDASALSTITTTITKQSSVHDDDAYHRIIVVPVAWLDLVSFFVTSHTKQQKGA